MENPEEKDHLNKLLQTHRAALRILQNQHRQLGSTTPVATHLAIEERIRTIIDLKAQLGQLGVEVTDERGDVLPMKPVSPYPGIQPFTATKAATFFGRNREIQDLLRLLSLGRFRPKREMAFANAGWHGFANRYGWCGDGWCGGGQL